MEHDPKAKAIPDTAKKRYSKETRKKQILDAAIRCVLRSGFHAATIAEIAKDAGVSVGIIYRHFANKEAIIEDIVKLDINQLTSDIEASRQGAEEEGFETRLLDNVSLLILRQHDRKRSALVLEIYAEAARNIRVEGIVQKSATIKRELAIPILEVKALPQARDASLEARADVLGILVNGLLMHGIDHPHYNHNALCAALEPVVLLIMTGLTRPFDQQ